MSAPEPSPTSPSAPEPRRCPNCGAVVAERFCGACGQEWRSLRIPFHQLAGEALGELLSTDSRIGRTVARLFLRPGLATRTYLDGQRASQTSPVKLYLVASFLFFLVSAIGSSELGVVRSGDGADPNPDAGPASTEGARVDFPDEWIASLRAKGGVAAWFAGRLSAIEREPPKALEARITRGIVEHVPTAMFFLLPVLAVLLRLAYPRRRVFLAEHLVFALHAHAVAFVFLLPGAALGSEQAQQLGLLAAGGHFTLALRRVYGQGWMATVAKAALVGLAYLFALGVALVVVIFLALFL